MNYRASAWPILSGALLLALALDAQAQQRGSGLNPVGEFTLIANQGGTQRMAVLTIVLQNDLLAARVIFPGQPELALRTVNVEERTVTLSGRLQDADVLLVLAFDTDSTFSGSWSMAAQSGTLSGRRGVDPAAVEPTCPVASADTAPRSASPPVRRPGPHPDSARIVTTDIRLFWDIVDRSTPETLVQLLYCEYLRSGTDAVRDFIPNRIISANHLAQMVTSRRERYEAARRSSLAVDTMEQAIRAVFREMKTRYANAVFPDVYFVIGRLNTGGTTSPRGLLIGAEMYVDHSGVPHIVAHELVHYQQKPIPALGRTLLAQSIMEGSADFVAELISGRHINARAHEYALPRERALWQEFTEVMNGSDFTGWLYGNPPAGRPADIGYFFGYRIAQAYYEKAVDKGRAFQDILGISDHADFLRRSGYNPGVR